MSSDRYPCPCCGYRTFTRPAGGTMQLCPVCAWEDAPGETPYNQSNDIDLISAQRHFLTTGACEDEYLSVVRPPLPEEARSEHWMSFDELRLKIIADIEREFHHVKRDGGTTLHQMRYVDGGSEPDSNEMKEAGLKDPEAAWQDLPSTKLSQFSQSLIFLDDLGFRFYLPAFMRHAITTSHSELSYSDFEGVLWSLEQGPDHAWWSGSFAMLSPGQKQTIASFLSLFTYFDNDYVSGYAIKGLRNGWAAFIPDFLKLALS